MTPKRCFPHLRSNLASATLVALLVPSLVACVPTKKIKVNSKNDDDSSSESDNESSEDSDDNSSSEDSDDQEESTSEDKGPTKSESKSEDDESSSTEEESKSSETSSEGSSESEDSSGESEDSSSKDDGTGTGPDPECKVTAKWGDGNPFAAGTHIPNWKIETVFDQDGDGEIKGSETTPKSLTLEDVYCATPRNKFAVITFSSDF